MTCMYCDTGQWCLWEGGWLSYTPPLRALWVPCPDGMQKHKSWNVADHSIETYRAPQRYVSRRDASCRNCGRHASGLPTVVLEDCWHCVRAFFPTLHQLYCPQPHARRDFHFWRQAYTCAPPRTPRKRTTGRKKEETTRKEGRERRRNANMMRRRPSEPPPMRENNMKPASRSQWHQ